MTSELFSYFESTAVKTFGENFAYLSVANNKTLRSHSNRIHVRESLFVCDLAGCYMSTASLTVFSISAFIVVIVMQIVLI